MAEKGGFEPSRPFTSPILPPSIATNVELPSWMVLDGFELSQHTSRREFASVYLCPNPPWNPDICEKPPPRKRPKNPLGKPPTGPGTPWGTIDGRGATLNTGAAEEKVPGAS